MIRTLLALLLLVAAIPMALAANLPLQYDEDTDTVSSPAEITFTTINATEITAATANALIADVTSLMATTATITTLSASGITASGNITASEFSGDVSATDITTTTVTASGDMTATTFNGDLDAAEISTTTLTASGDITARNGIIGSVYASGSVSANSGFVGPSLSNSDAVTNGTPGGDVDITAGDDFDGSTGGGDVTITAGASGAGFRGEVILISGSEQSHMVIGDAAVEVTFPGGSGNFAIGDNTNAGSLTVTGNGISTTNSATNAYVDINSQRIMLNATRTWISGGRSAASGDNDNVFIAPGSGAALTTGDYSLCIGKNSGALITTGSNNIMLGYYAGKYQPATTSGRLIIDAFDRTTSGGEDANAILAGTLSASGAVSQTLTVNATLDISQPTATITRSAEDQPIMSLRTLSAAQAPTSTGTKGEFGYYDGKVYIWTDTDTVIRMAADHTW